MEYQMWLLDAVMVDSNVATILGVVVVGLLICK
jgi:hypothetical protein